MSETQRPAKSIRVNTPVTESEIQEEIRLLDAYIMFALDTADFIFAKDRIQLKRAYENTLIQMLRHAPR